MTRSVCSEYFKQEECVLDKKQNISGENSKVQVWIIPTDEEYMIALDTEKIANE